MRNLKKLMVLTLVAVALLSVTAIAQSQSTTIGDAQTAIQDGYKALVKADNAGADINELADQLNIALNLTSQAQDLIEADPQTAQNLASQAQVLAQNITEQASNAKNEELLQQPIVVAVIMAVLISGGILVYIYGPKMFWKTWLRLRKNYRIKAKNSTTAKNKGLIITAEQVCAVILGITLIIAFFVASPFSFAKRD
jgi:predicted PurR-regulated permease PerM